MSRSLMFSMTTWLFFTFATVSDSGPAAAAVKSDGAAVIFVAHDYGFAGPDRIPAGLVTMQVVNKGQDMHQIQVLRLPEGKTSEDFRAAISADAGRLPEWVKFVGGPNAVRPGGASTATMNLAEGRYLLICIIPNQQGVPHVALGMQKALTVKGGKPSTVSDPKARVTITQEDFRFVLSGPIKPGTHMVRVANHGSQPHEVVLVKLAPGASAREFGEAVEPGASGPPPGMPVGGVVGIEKGEQAFFTADFAPGRYGLICFFPDPVTGKPHYAQGMTSEFDVKE